MKENNLKFDKSCINIPNILSLIRIILVPVFVYTYIFAQDNTGNTMYVLSAIILAFSGLTDMLDGIIARKFNMITWLGKILDPIADKLTQFVVCICLAIKIENFIYLVILVLIKEIAILIGGAYIIKKNKVVVSSKWYGKAATFLFYIVVVLAVLLPNLNVFYMNAMIVFTAAFMVFAFVMYGIEFIKSIKKRENIE